MTRWSGNTSLAEFSLQRAGVSTSTQALREDAMKTRACKLQRTAHIITNPGKHCRLTQPSKSYSLFNTAWKMFLACSCL